jgi:uncharacterized membrane protein
MFPFLRRDPWGMSIFFTSPMFLWAGKAPWNKKESVIALLTVCVLALVIFGYYGIGYNQFGYRYALDFYPFLFLLLCYGVKQRISNWLKIVILCSFCLNFFLLSV